MFWLLSVKVTGRSTLLKSADGVLRLDAHRQHVLDHLLRVPRLVEFRAVERRRADDAVIALYAAGLAVGIAGVDLEELEAERCAFPGDEFFGVDAEPDEKRAVVGPAAVLGAASDNDVGVRQPDAAQADTPLVAQAERSAEPAGAGREGRRRRIAADRGDFLCRDRAGCGLRRALRLHHAAHGHDAGAAQDKARHPAAPLNARAARHAPRSK
jgi:hypothetical protein